MAKVHIDSAAGTQGIDIDVTTDGSSKVTLTPATTNYDLELAPNGTGSVLGALAPSVKDAVTVQTTVSATLVDITGLSQSVTLAEAGAIWAVMTFQASTTGGGGATVGAWAISINSVDSVELQRNLSGTSDAGIGCVQHLASLAAGTYTVTGRHRRVSGASTLNTVADLVAICVAAP